MSYTNERMNKVSNLWSLFSSISSRLPFDACLKIKDRSKFTGYLARVLGKFVSEKVVAAPFRVINHLTIFFLKKGGRCGGNEFFKMLSHHPNRHTQNSEIDNFGILPCVKILKLKSLILWKSSSFPYKISFLEN